MRYECVCLSQREGACLGVCVGVCVCVCPVNSPHICCYGSEVMKCGGGFWGWTSSRATEVNTCRYAAHCLSFPLPLSLSRSLPPSPAQKETKTQDETRSSST